MDQRLSVYRQVRPLISSNHGTRNEFTISVDPGDEVARIKVCLTLVGIRSHVPTCVLRVSTGLADRRWRSVEITALSMSEPKAGTLTLSQSSDATEVLFAPGDNPPDRLVFTFIAWEVLGPVDGTEPYYQSQLSMRLALPSSSPPQVLVTLDADPKVTPRSTQGNFHLAYPSRLCAKRRHTLLYYTATEAVELRYVMGWVEPRYSPWLLALKSTLAILLVVMLQQAPGTASSTRTVLVLGSAIVTFALYIGDLLASAFEMRIYRRDLPSHPLPAVVCACLVLGIYSWTIVDFLATSAASPVLKAVSLATLVNLAIVTIVGLILQYLGVWNRYCCDVSGCPRRLVIRRNRQECVYTGRVPCDRHIATMCSACRHGSDLLTGSMRTASEYDPKSMPCVRPFSTS